MIRINPIRRELRQHTKDHACAAGELRYGEKDREALGQADALAARIRIAQIVVATST